MTPGRISFSLSPPQAEAGATGVRECIGRSQLPNEFTGKTALVTGASRGIGAAAAIALARAGAGRIVVHYNRFREGAEATLAEVRAAGAQAEALGGDLGEAEGIRSFLSELAAAAPEVDILINNAGSLVQRARLLEGSEDLFDRVMNLNFKSAWAITRAVAPAMMRKRSGIIVNISSIAARNGGGPGASVYAAAKAAVMTITKGWARELAPHGIRVNGVSPGTVDNYFHQQFSNRHILDSVVAQTPAGRLATNEDVADVIVFLCSEAARYVHAQTIEVNGGMLAP
ncbi:MAG: SDR family oxidoreductase [Acidobacteria bacterium]|nr:SDR family oxidoreductase [Acidobacteriota bacterium]